MSTANFPHKQVSTNRHARSCPGAVITLPEQRNYFLSACGQRIHSTELEKFAVAGPQCGPTLPQIYPCIYAGVNSDERTGRKHWERVSMCWHYQYQTRMESHKTLNAGPRCPPIYRINKCPQEIRHARARSLRSRTCEHVPAPDFAHNIMRISACWRRHSVATDVCSMHIYMRAALGSDSLQVLSQL